MKNIGWTFLSVKPLCLLKTVLTQVAQRKKKLPTRLWCRIFPYRHKSNLTRNQSVIFVNIYQTTLVFLILRMWWLASIRRFWSCPSARFTIFSVQPTVVYRIRNGLIAFPSNVRRQLSVCAELLLFLFYILRNCPLCPRSWPYTLYRSLNWIVFVLCSGKMDTRKFCLG